MDQGYNTARQEQPIGYDASQGQGIEYQTTPRRPCCHKGCADCPW